jgi:capsular exopolysaccharide synthesis family protein
LNITEPTYNRLEKTENEVDIKIYLFKFLHYKFWFVLSIICCLIVAFIFNKLQKPIYKVSNTILINENEKNPVDLGMFSENSMILKQTKKLENEIGILTSRSIIEKTLNQLSFEVEIYENQFLRKKELFLQSPFTVVVDQNHLQPLDKEIEITILDENTFSVLVKKGEVELMDYSQNSIMQTTEIENFSITSKWDETIVTPWMNFKLIKNSNISLYLNKKYSLYFRHRENLIHLFSKALSVDLLKKNSSIVKLDFQYSEPKKAELFLNTLANVYIQESLSEKNKIANRTVDFIANQLSVITDSLSIVENNLEKFRVKNTVISLSKEGELLFDKAKELEQKKSILKTQKKYYHYLQEYLAKDNSGEIVMPSGVGIDDQLLNENVKKLLALQAEKNDVSQQLKEDNPMIIKYNQQIISTTNVVLESIKSNLYALQLQEKDIQTEISQTDEKIEKLPGTEREYINIQRKFNINESVYVFLLQRKAEAEIAQAANIPDHKIIDKVVPTNTPVYPVPLRNYLIAFFIGLFIPASLIILRDYFNHKVEGINDIEQLTNIPILGVVSHNFYNQNLVVFKNSRSIIAESFRALRSNLQFLAPDKMQKTILMTSSVSGEGKSFCSSNLAASLALAGKSTIILGTDLRKPKIFNDFSLKNTVGLTSYLIGTASLEQVIQSTGIQNLDLISAGPIPPNPSELLMSEKLNTLIKELKLHYDYIVIDTPPIGVIADAFELLKFADIVLYVVRQQYTDKNLLKYINDLYNKKSIQQVSIILNDFNVTRSYAYNTGSSQSYGYIYGYGHAYGQNYFDEAIDLKNGRVKKLIKKIKTWAS